VDGDERGLAAPGSALRARDVLDAFDPARLDRAPTVLDPQRPLAQLLSGRAR